MKKIISLAIVLVMVISLVPAFALHAAADTTVYKQYKGAECTIDAGMDAEKRTAEGAYNLDYYEKDLYAPATTLEEGKVYKALYLFTVVRINNFDGTSGWDVKCMPTEEYYFNITNADISNNGGAQKTIVSVPFKVTNAGDVKLKLWTHGALVDGTQLDGIWVVGADYNAYDVEGYDVVVEGLANAGSNKDNNKPDAYTASVPPLKEGATVDGGVWEVNNGTYTLKETRARNHDGFNTYILGSSDETVTLKYDFVVGKGDNFASDAGFLFAVEDLDGDGAIKEGKDNYYLIDLRSGGTVGIEKNAKNWGGWAKESASFASNGDTVTLEATYDPSAHKITVKANGEQVLEWTDENNALTGTGYALASKQDAGSKIVKTAEPVPTTGDSAAVVLVIVSVVALAGVAVAAKKRAIQK